MPARCSRTRTSSRRVCSRVTPFSSSLFSSALASLIAVPPRRLSFHVRPVSAWALSPDELRDRMGRPMALPRSTPAANRVLRALGLLALVMLFGGVAYYALGGGRWSLESSIYMAVITVSTVGFAELPAFEQVPGAHELTTGIIILGIAAVAYFQSTMTALLVEGTIGHAWRRTRMKRQIETLSHHIVVAGIGSTGRHVVEELRATSTPLVAIDRNRDHLERVS